MNLLIAPFTHGLLGAAFPTTGIPEIPKPRLSPLDPALHIMGVIGLGAAGSNTAGGLSERIIRQWSGTLAWPGTEFTRNERKEVRAQVTATASKGDPCAFFSMGFFCRLKTYIRSLIQTRINMASSFVTCACWACSANR